MSRSRINTVLATGKLAVVRERALWLAQLNECLQRQLPLSINTAVRLANIDTRKRAVVHVRGGEWATQVRMQQGLIKAILRSCGVSELTGVVIKNRPLKNLAEESLQPTRQQRPISQSNRQLVESAANGVSDERLKLSLQRLARKRV